MSDVEKAVELFTGGCACSQAGFAAYAPRFGLEEGTALRISAGFASGMRMGEVCGAVTGAIMALGLASCGDLRNREGREPLYAKLTPFLEEFKARHGTVICKELLGCNPGTPEGGKEATEKRLFRTVCPAFVRTAAELLEEALPAEQAADRIS